MTIREIFLKAQDRVQYHAQLSRDLLAVYKKTKFEEFCSEFLKYVYQVLKYTEDNHYADYIIDFIVLFSTSSMTGTSSKASNVCDKSEEEWPFLEHLFQSLVKLKDVDETVVRLRTCKIIGKLLNSMSLETMIADDLYEEISNSLLHCLNDKIATIRVQAVTALQRMQDPSNKECPVVKKYLQHLSTDPNPFVRIAILQVIGASVSSLPIVLERTRDVKESIRKAAYVFLADKVHIKSLSISQRCRLLTEGLKDRTELVQKEVEHHLLPAWMKMCKDNILEFLKLLNVQGTIEAAELSVKLYLKKKHPKELCQNFNLVDERKLIPYEDLNCENSFYWNLFVNHLKTDDEYDGEEYLDEMLPSIVEFCQYVKDYIKSYDNNWSFEEILEHEFISEQLLSIASSYNLSDLAGRQCLESTIREALLNCNINNSVSCIKPMVSCIRLIHLDLNEQLEVMAQLISTIREPTLTPNTYKSAEELRQYELKVAGLKVKLEMFRDELQHHITNEEFDSAKEIKEKIKELEEERNEFENAANKIPSTCEENLPEKDDSETMLKCLTMMSQLLLQSDFKKISPILMSLIDNLFIPGIQTVDYLVRNQAVLCLGLACCLDRFLAMRHFSLILHISEVDNFPIAVTALKAVYDILAVYGSESFEEQVSDDVVPETPPQGEEPASNAVKIIDILECTLNSKEDKVCSASAQGLAKLLVLGRIQSPEILSRLILLWFNPITERDTELYNYLGVALTTLAKCKSPARFAFEECFMPTLKAVFDASKSNPLSMIQPVLLGKFLLDQIRNVQQSSVEAKNMEPGAGDGPEDRIAENILRHILKDSDTIASREWTKLLNEIHLTEEARSIRKDLNRLTERILKKMKDRTSRRNFEKFHKYLLEMKKVESEESDMIEDTKSPGRNLPSLDTLDDSESFYVPIVRGAEKATFETAGAKDRHLAVLMEEFTSSSDSSDEFVFPAVPPRSNNQKAEKASDSNEIITVRQTRSSSLPSSGTPVNKGGQRVTRSSKK